jgi:IS1 family transposase
MNKLSLAKRVQLLSCLVEGNSLRSTSRMTGVAVKTVMQFVEKAGRVCAEYQDRTFHSLKCKRLQCDEIWAFCGAKEKNTTPDKKAEGWGDCWTWTAIDTETKLVPCWLVGDRSADAALQFMNDLASRLAGRVQLTTDGLRAYIGAVDDAFGNGIDFAQLVKIYGNPQTGETRYSPPECTGTRKTVMTGKPEDRHISTSYVERQNLNMRMGMRRFTRLTNAFSKKISNHHAAISLFYMHHNFCRVHSSLNTTPAVAAGITGRVWTLADIADMLDVAERLAA